MQHQRYPDEHAHSNGSGVAHQNEEHLPDGPHAVQQASLAIGTQGEEVLVWEAIVKPVLSPLRLACTLVRDPSFLHRRGKFCRVAGLQTFLSAVQREQGSLTSLSFSPDGHTLAIGTGAGLNPAIISHPVSLPPSDVALTTYAGACWPGVRLLSMLHWTCVRMMGSLSAPLIACQFWPSPGAPALFLCTQSGVHMHA